MHSRDVPDAADFRLTVHGPAPAWLSRTVVYQIFPDRFARSGEVRPAPDWAEPADWDERTGRPRPEHRPAVLRRRPRRHRGRLDHLERLGVGTVYLTPVFPARSNHRYDATSFDHVDPLLGGDGALASLSRALHARGMHLVGDVTTNHTGAGHEWFTRALADPSSVEAGFYYWTGPAPGHVAGSGTPRCPS